MLSFVQMLPYLFEVYYNATFFHHGVLFIVLHQVSQGVKPLTTTHVVLAVLLKTKVDNSTTSQLARGVL